MANIEADVLRIQAQTKTGLETALRQRQMGEVVGTSEAPLAVAGFKRLDNTYGYIKSSSTFTAADTTAMLALDTWEGDTCTLPTGDTYKRKNNTGHPSLITDWTQISSSSVDLDNVPSITFDGTTPASPAEGEIWYDTTDNTLMVQSDISNTTLNVGQEQLIRCGNYTGSTIADGKVVYINGAQGNRPTITLATYTDIDTVNKTIGVVTADIAHGAEGYVCISGAVSGYNTSTFTAGDRLYLSSAGGLTKTMPAYGVVGIAYALNSINNGKILVVVHRGNTVDAATPFTGFNNPDLVTSVYDPAALKITLSGTAIFYYRGVAVFDLNAGNHVSAARTAGNGIWFYYYNGTSYVWSLTPWTFDMGMLGIVYKSATAEFGICEPHGYMEAPTHRRLHEEIGTSRIGTSGVASGVVVNSTNATNRRPAFTASVLRDEDVTTTIDAQSATNYTRMHIGSSNTTVFTTSSAEIVELSGALPRVNNPSDGTFTTLSANEYMNVFVIDVPTMSDTGSKVFRRWFLNGQLASLTKSVIDSQTISSLNLGDVNPLYLEFVFGYRYLIRREGSDWVIVSENRLTGNKAAQISGSSAGPVALANLVSGGLSLIPVGTTASGHTVFDGTTTADKLSFGSTAGLFTGATGDTALTVHSAKNTGSSIMEFSALDSASNLTTYASAGAEITDATNGSEDGAFVVKAIVAGAMTEQFRAVGGRTGFGRIPTTYPVEVQGGVYAYGNGATAYIYSHRSTGERLYIGGEFGKGGIGTESNHPLHISANNTLALTLGTDQSATFAGKAFFPTAGIQLGNSGSWPTANVGDIIAYGLGATASAGGLYYCKQAGTWMSLLDQGGTQSINGAKTWTVPLTISATRGLALTGAGAPTTAGDFAHGTASSAPPMPAFIGFGGATNNTGNFARTIYSMFSGSAVTGSVNATTILNGTARGTKTLIANAFKPNKVFRIKIMGYYAANGAYQTQFVVYHGTNQLTPPSSNCVITPVSFGGYFEYTAEVICQTTTTATVISKLICGGNALTDTTEYISAVQGTTVSASSLDLDVKIVHSNTSSSATAYYATIEEC